MRKYGKLLYLLSVFFRSIAADLEFLILHNNDMHARFEEGTNSLNHQKVGGFARTLHVIKEARENAVIGRGPPVLFLNAGDIYTGSPWFSVHKWKIAAAFLNLLQPDAACLGNHEFDKDISGLVPFINALTFPIVAANLDLRGEPTLASTKIAPSAILEVNGTKIGVIGYLTPETRILSITGHIIFNEEVEAIRKESEKLHEQGIKIIIALGHSGYATDKKIAAEVPLVDIVIGGHTNTFLWNGPPPDKEKPVDGYPTVITQRSGKRVPVVQAYAYTKYMGKLHVVFDKNGDLKSFHGQPVFLNQGVPQDEEALRLLEKFKPEVNKLFENTIGKSSVYLSNEDCRVTECNLGNLILDSYVDYKTSTYKGHYWTDASIAVMNGGAIRNSIDVKMKDGNLTKGDLLDCLPFEQMLVTTKMNGRDLLETLELGVRSNGETSKGEFLQVSGLHVVYDMSKPVGKRVVQAKALCNDCTVPKYEKIIPEKYYGVIVTDFLIGGGDGHNAISRNTKYSKIEKVNDIEALERFIIKNQIVHPVKDERITFLNSDDQEQSNSFVNKPNAFIYVNVLLIYTVIYSRLCID